ncbi:MAG: hypothetical protein J6D36_09905, partial [Erysipelotrichaceae bacterium]|nr:hypothetical protein [Erysipelotrichaceae bacterium]
GTDAKRMERDGYDALYMDVHFAPYGWDVDTLFVMNKDIIVPEEKREVLRLDEAFPNVVLTDNDGYGIKYDEWVVDCRTADEIVATIQFDRDEQFLSYTITIDKEKNLKLYEGDWYWDGCEIDISEIKSERILKDVQEMKNTLEEMKKKDKQITNISKTESNSKRVGSFSELFDRVEEMKASDVDDGKIHGGSKEDFLPG